MYTHIVSVIITTLYIVSMTLNKKYRVDQSSGRKQKLRLAPSCMGGWKSEGPHISTSSLIILTVNPLSSRMDD